MKTAILGFLIIFFSMSLFAQDENEIQNLEGQFNSIMEDTETFKDYKVVKIEILNNFWKAIEDSLAAKSNEVARAEQRIAEQQNTIAQNEQKMAEGQALVDQAEYDREHITVLGIDFLKSTFIIGCFVVIAALLALIAYGYGKYKYSTSLASDKTKSYEKLEQEYKDYQQKSKENQMKLKRDLQTQINKFEELKHKNISFK